MRSLATRIMLAGSLVVVSACATVGGRITEVQPGVYTITHVMYAHSPVKGVRQGVIDRAIKKCENQNRTYAKLREEMGNEGTLSYTLIFTCEAK